MPGRVEDKVVIVTGGASGIGGATSRLLAAEGARVVIADLNEEGGQAIAKEIGGDAVFLLHDVSDEESWRGVIAATLERFGRLDALVNNARAPCGR
jgi:3(or 17)beta-hydroxysteroid dehydrogenase